jgi:hypothetical protein
MSNEWECLIGVDYMHRGIKIAWSRGEPPGAVEYSNGREVTQQTDHGVEVNVDPLTLRDDMARSLLAALLRHYNGADDARMLRKDYDAERARVDRLIGALLPVQP